MRAGGGTLFLETEGRHIGPGHAGIYTFQGEAGAEKYVFTFHYYDGQDRGQPKLGARYLEWAGDDWPMLKQNFFE